MRANLVIITLLSSIGFFNFHNLVSQPMQRAMFLFMFLVSCFVAFLTRMFN